MGIRAQGTELRPWVLALAGYAALTLVMTWPLATHLGSAMTHDHGDPALGTWIFWWNAHNVPLTARWWNAPIFWPATGVFAFSEHLLGITLVTTPLQWLGASPLQAYNIAFLLSFPLSALAAHGLAWTVAKRHDAALVAGLVFGFNPYRMAQVPHIQMMWAFGMPAALMALHRYLDHRQRGWLVAFAAAWLVLASSNGYYMVFFAVLLGCWILWFTAGRSLADMRAIVLTWFIASLPLLPILWTYKRIHSAFRMERGIGEIEYFSADLTAIIAASPELAVWHGLSRWSRPEGQLFPGALALVLVLCAVVVSAWSLRGRTRDGSGRFHKGRLVLMAIGLVVVAVAVSPMVIGPWQIANGGRVLLSVASPEKPLSIALPLLALTFLTGPTFLGSWRRRSMFGFYTFGAVLMFILSLGPRVKFGGVQVMFRAPYYWLLAIPGFSELRAPGRFGMLLVLCLSVAAALAFARLTGSSGRRGRQALAGVVGLVVIVESWQSMILAAPPAAISALSGIERGIPVMELPIGIVDRDIAAEYRSIGHGHPVVNGWGGYDPPHYLVLRTALRLGDGGVLNELARGRSLAVVVDHGWDFELWSALVERQHGQLVADDGEHRVYRLSGEATPAAVVGGTRLPIQSVVASVGSGRVGLLLDDDPKTWWNSERVQSGGEQLLVDLGRERYVSGVRLGLGIFISDYPRQLAVECTGDAERWEPCWTGSAGAIALQGVRDDPRNPVMSVPIERPGVRRLRLRQTGADPLNGWSIADLAVFGR